MSPFTNTFRLKPNELFCFCESQERKFKSIDGNKFLRSLGRTLLFGGPIFSDGPVSRKKNGYRFDATITRPRRTGSEWRYAALLETLKTLDEVDLRWLLIARWLESEGVCQAEDFLPREILERLLERVSKARLRASPSDLQQARWVSIWLPYFKKLLVDAEKTRKARRRSEDALLKMGYVQDAVQAIDGTSSAVHATASWLAFRDDDGQENGINERTLENAYSRVNVARQKFDNEYFRGNKRHRPDIDPEYYSFLHLIS